MTNFKHFIAISCVFSHLSLVVQSCLFMQPSTLDCSQHGLTTFNASSLQLNTTDVQVLKLNNNHLQRVPDLSSFSQLTTLDLAHNNISHLPDDGFASLSYLAELNISQNEIILSRKSVEAKAFNGLTNLQVLRMKQKYSPSSDFDYAVLEPLKGSLKELYITGTPKYSNVFHLFNNLQTLSLGGQGCHVPSLTNSRMSALRMLPLVRLSARHCQVTELDRQFLGNFRQTLKKLDLSCNPLKPFLAEITNGLAHGLVDTLILDHITERGKYCSWTSTSDSDIAPLKFTPLEVLSLRANQIDVQTKLNLRDFSSNLIYLDLSNNQFAASALYYAKAIRGETISNANRANLLHSTKLVPLSVRHLVLESVTDNHACGEVDKGIMNCDEENSLFTEDLEPSESLYEPLILDFDLLSEVLDRHKDYYSVCVALKCSSGITDLLISGNAMHRVNIAVITLKAMVRATVHYLWHNGDGLRTLGSRSRAVMPYFPYNVTSLRLGYNKFEFSETPKCTNSLIYINNLGRLDLSYTSMRKFSCPSLKGLYHVSRFVCRHCEITDWQENFFTNFSLTHLDVTANKLGARIRNDFEQIFFRSLSKLTELLVGEQLDGIRYFPNEKYLSSFPDLVTIDLHGNQLTDWNLTIASESKLTSIDFRNNSVSQIRKQFRNNIDERFDKVGLQLDIRDNSVDCVPTNVEYIKWLLNSRAVVYKESLLCSSNETVSLYYLRITTTARPTPRTISSSTSTTVSNVTSHPNSANTSATETAEATEATEATEVTEVQHNNVSVLIAAVSTSMGVVFLAVAIVTYLYKRNVFIRCFTPRDVDEELDDLVYAEVDSLWEEDAIDAPSRENPHSSNIVYVDGAETVSSAYVLELPSTENEEASFPGSTDAIPSLTLVDDNFT